MRVPQGVKLAFVSNDPAGLKALLFDGRGFQSIVIGSPEDRARHKPPPTTAFARWSPPCECGHSQRPRAAIGYRDKLGGLIQLRTNMSETEGICSVVIQESHEFVLVRVILCRRDETGTTAPS